MNTELASTNAGTSLLDELMTAQQIAGILQMRVSTIEEYARRGLLPSIKLGRHRRFVRSDVEAAILQLCCRR
jgi:excisionase family DNA binding protein